MSEVVIHLLLESSGVQFWRLGTSVQLAIALDCSLQKSLGTLLEVIQLEIINDADEIADIWLFGTFENMVISGQ
jgi:hypothetical protein